MEKVCYLITLPDKTYTTNRKDKARRAQQEGATVTEIRDFVWVVGRCRYALRVTVAW